MPRVHTVWLANEHRQVDIEFTVAEELARDREELESEQEAIALRDKASRLDALTARLADDGITLVEVVELLRLERGI